MGQRNRHPKPGDLIEIDRPLYQHWALYLGAGYVIHVTDDGASALSSGSSSVFSSRAKVKKQLLKEVVGNNEWRVNNKYDRSHTPLPMEKIIRHAERWIDREVPYDVLNNNCEHFVTMLRYGDPVSDQVVKALTRWDRIGIVAWIGLAGVCILAGNPLISSAATVALLADMRLNYSRLRHRSACPRL